MISRNWTYLILVALALALIAITGCSSAADPEAAKESLEQLKTKGRIDEVSEVNFIYSAEKSDLEAVNLYLASGMDPNVKNEYGNTPLLAAVNGDEASPLYYQNVEVVESLMKAGADTSVVNPQGETVMDIALRLGRVKVAKVLEERTGVTQ